MIETILIARDRKTGKDVLLAGREVPFRKQLEAYKELCGSQNDDYATAVLAQVQPQKKPLKFVTKAEAEARAKEAKKLEESTKAEAEAKAKSPAKKKNAADKTETKTGTDTGSNSET